MVEYIERGKALALLDDPDRLGYLDAYDINSIPAADVVPVVRCKDCKYHAESEDGLYLCNRKMFGLVRPEDFCSFGIREE